MSESGDYDPGPWAGHDFTSAYRHYDSHVGRSYADASVKKVSSKDLLEPSIQTNCKNPLLIWCDVTGSMGEWPKVMFSKLPYLEHEAKEYLGKDLEIAFGAIGDGSSGDRYPLQMRPFTSGTDLKDRMLELVVEGGGGRGLSESYEMAGVYSLYNVKMPKAIKPILIIIGDEKPYEAISVEDAKAFASVELQKRLSTKHVFDELKKKFSVYLIRKPYGSSSGNSLSSHDIEINAAWSNLLGADHICELPSADRVVDVIFGILAKETDRIEYFKEEIEGRQRKDQVTTVYKSLASIHKLPAKSKSGGKTEHGQSILKLTDRGRASRPLLGSSDDDE